MPSGQFSFAEKWERPRHSEVLGALDLGGASAQITFQPGVPVEDRNTSVSFRLYGSDYSLYTHSYLCYGRTQALKMLLAALHQVPRPPGTGACSAVRRGRDRALQKGRACLCEKRGGLGHCRELGSLREPWMLPAEPRSSAAGVAGGGGSLPGLPCPRSGRCPREPVAVPAGRRRLALASPPRHGSVVGPPAEPRAGESLRGWVPLLLNPPRVEILLWGSVCAQGGRWAGLSPASRAEPH